MQLTDTTGMMQWRVLQLVIGVLPVLPVLQGRITGILGWHWDKSDNPSARKLLVAKGFSPVLLGYWVIFTNCKKNENRT
jgi:hypothetical protein